MGKELQEAKGAIGDTQQKLAEQSAVRARSLPAPGTQGCPCYSAPPRCHPPLLELAGGGRVYGGIPTCLPLQGLCHTKVQFPSPGV